ncbi:MAG: phage tail assembly chaperone, partial [bacterium]|nr:phage tail assembly chaperone [bacterium]
VHAGGRDVSRFDWASLLRAGVRGLGLRPDEFWALTPAELHLLLGHCRGIRAAMERGKAGEVYNFGGDAERENLFVVHEILRLVGRDDSLIEYVKDRPGHDRRYAMDSSKAARELDWRPQFTFEEGLQATVNWYLDNKTWWERVRSGAYQEYYETQYGQR